MTPTPPQAGERAEALDARDVQDRVVAWMDNGSAWVTPRSPPAGLHALVLADDYAAIVARLEVAEADARRYRWLRSRIPGSTYRIAGVIYSEGGPGVDTAIDAAIAALDSEESK